MRPLVLKTEDFDDEPVRWLRERCTVVECAPGNDGFAESLAQADALLVRTYTIVDDALLQAAPRVRVVARGGVGLDNIDLRACERRGIRVVHTPDANTQAVVEYVFTLIGDALRPRVTLTRAVSSAEWRQLRAETVADRQLSECTLGILGLGRIGRRVAEVAHAIGMRVLYNDLVEIATAERHGAQPVAVETLFADADILTIHVDGRTSNRGFVRAALIDRMKPNVLLLNTSRGFVVAPEALAAFLRAHPDALALLDVHEPEPVTPDSPLLGLPNARLFPHLASRTRTATSNMSWVVRPLWEALSELVGGSPDVT